MVSQSLKSRRRVHRTTHHQSLCQELGSTAGTKPTWEIPWLVNCFVRLSISCFGCLWEIWTQVLALYLGIRCSWTTAFFWIVRPDTVGSVRAGSCSQCLSHCPSQERGIWETLRQIQPWPLGTYVGTEIDWDWFRAWACRWTKLGGVHGQAWRLALLWCCWDRDWCPCGTEMGSWVLGRVGVPQGGVGSVRQGWWCHGGMLIYTHLSHCSQPIRAFTEGEGRMIQKGLHSPLPYYRKVTMCFSTSTLFVLHVAKLSKVANSSYVRQREPLYPRQACEARSNVKFRRPFVSMGPCNLHTAFQHQLL